MQCTLLCLRAAAQKWGPGSGRLWPDFKTGGQWPMQWAMYRVSLVGAGLEVAGVG